MPLNYYMTQAPKNGQQMIALFWTDSGLGNDEQYITLIVVTVSDDGMVFKPAEDDQIPFAGIPHKTVDLNGCGAFGDVDDLVTVVMMGVFLRGSQKKFCRKNHGTHEVAPPETIIKKS